MEVLLSIKPQFADAIFSGEKQFEFRKVIFRQRNIRKIYLYASRPVCSVVGEFEIRQVIARDPETLWSVTKEFSGITREYFDEYFRGKNIAYAIQVSSPLKYPEPFTLMDLFNVKRPPQSFMYVDSCVEQLVLSLAILKGAKYPPQNTG